MGTEEERESALNTGCQGKTKSGEPCGNKVRPSQAFCHTHRYQMHKSPAIRFLTRRLGNSVHSPTVVGLALTVLGLVLTLFFGYYTLKSPTKEDIVNLLKQVKERRPQNQSQSHLTNESANLPVKIVPAEVPDSVQVDSSLRRMINMANAAIESRNMAKARQICGILVTLDSHNEEYRRTLASIYCQSYLESNDYEYLDSAAIEYEIMLAFKPLDCDILDNLSLVYAGMKELSRAALLLELAVGLDSLGAKKDSSGDLHSIDRLVNLGDIYETLGLNAEAERSFNHALEINDSIRGSQDSLSKSIRKRLRTIEGTK